MQNTNGKVAVVTGGGSGIGRALADRFASAGMKIMLADIDQAAGEQAAEEIRAGGTEVAFRRVDVGERLRVRAQQQRVGHGEAGHRGRPSA